MLGLIISDYSLEGLLVAVRGVRVQVGTVCIPRTPEQGQGDRTAIDTDAAPGHDECFRSYAKTWGAL